MLDYVTPCFNGRRTELGLSGRYGESGSIVVAVERKPSRRQLFEENQL
jgi:hypothetical protein